MTIPNALSDGPSSGLSAATMRASLDRDFRARLLDDPHTAIREAFGVELPASFRLKFVEKSGELDLLVVLPDLVETVLSSEALETVSGGAPAVCYRVRVRI